MQLNSIRNCKKKKDYWLQKIEDYNLTKQKYFKCKIYNKLLPFAPSFSLDYRLQIYFLFYNISFNHTRIKFHLTNGIPKQSLIGGALIRRFQNNQNINW